MKCSGKIAFVPILLMMNHCFANGLVWEHTSLTSSPDFGSQNIVGKFSAKNNSTVAVKIQSVRSSCDCLKIVSTPQTVEPNKSGEIDFAYDGKNKEGIQTGKIFVQLGATGEKGSEVNELEIQVNLRPRVSLSPGLVVWQKSLEERTIEVAVLDPSLKMADKLQVGDAFQLKVEAHAKTKKYQLRVKPLRKAEDWLLMSFVGPNKSDHLERRIRLIAQ